jgi:hypothetical protein
MLPILLGEGGEVERVEWLDNHIIASDGRVLQA